MTEKQSSAPAPTPIMRLTTAYWESQAFFTANRIGLFELLAKGPLHVEAVASALGTAVRPTALLLRACVALELLEEMKDGYHNTPLSNEYLVSGTRTYMGNAVRYGDDLYEAWGDLEKLLRDDRPVLPQEEYLGKDQERTRHFVYGMHNRALGIGAVLASMVDLSGKAKMLDVGGGPGTYSALFTQRNPGLQSVVMDLPPVVALADEILGGLGARDQVTTLPGDYTDTPFPGGNDVVLISGVFHRETEAACRQLIAKAAGSLGPGGLLLISDVFTDNNGNGPLFATLFGLNMALSAPDGGVHADADVAAWMETAGFEAIKVCPFPPPMPHRLIMGYLA